MQVYLREIVSDQPLENFFIKKQTKQKLNRIVFGDNKPCESVGSKTSCFTCFKAKPASIFLLQQHSPFFAEQLTAFQVWLTMGVENRNPPEQLPIVLQVSARSSAAVPSARAALPAR